jgi:hypothetical protein
MGSAAPPALHRGHEWLAAQLACRRPARDRRPRVHFLHVSKTGGTAIKSALGPLAAHGRYELRLHEHRVVLGTVPRGELVFFAVRDPLERYVSGFYSRWRQGRPRYEVPWTSAEATAFSTFDSANALAEALSADEQDRRASAERAMGAIGHVCDSYWRWFGDRDHLNARADDILAIIWLPSLNRVFGALCERLCLCASPRLPDDDVAAHRTPRRFDRLLSPLAIRNLRLWYGRDFEFVELCRRHPSFMA